MNLKNLIDENGHCEIPSSVTEIGDCAFYNCTALRSVTIPLSVIEIGHCAFYGCPALKSDRAKTIWKWTLQSETTVNMPHGAKLLAVQEQRGEPRLWALVDPGAETRPRTFRVYGTGDVLPEEPGRYIGTFQTDDGTQVFHVFETTFQEN